jgi:hypothetical protein
MPEDRNHLCDHCEWETSPFQTPWQSSSALDLSRPGLHNSSALQCEAGLGRELVWGFCFVSGCSTELSTMWIWYKVHKHFTAKGTFYLPLQNLRESQAWCLAKQALLLMCDVEFVLWVIIYLLNPRPELWMWNEGDCSGRNREGKTCQQCPRQCTQTGLGRPEEKKKKQKQTPNKGKHLFLTSFLPMNWICVGGGWDWLLFWGLWL